MKLSRFYASFCFLRFVLCLYVPFVAINEMFVALFFLSISLSVCQSIRFRNSSACLKRVEAAVVIFIFFLLSRSTVNTLSYFDIDNDNMTTQIKLCNFFCRFEFLRHILSPLVFTQILTTDKWKKKPILIHEINQKISATMNGQSSIEMSKNKTKSNEK